MSEYRTHLRESVEALRDAAQRVAEALDETAGSGAGVSSAVPDPTGSSVGELSDAAPSPAPSSPPDARRWWLVKFEGWTTFLCTTEAEERRMFPGRARTVIPVVPAAALDAMREERDQAIHEQHVANDHLASLRRVIAKRGPEMQALDEAIRDRGCYDPALTVAQNALTYINQLGEWLDQRTNSANALLVERDAAIRELRAARRLTPEVLEKAAAASYKRRTGWRWPASDRASCGSWIEDTRAALLAAGFQEVDNG